MARVMRHQCALCHIMCMADARVCRGRAPSASCWAQGAPAGPTTLLEPAPAHLHAQALERLQHLVAQQLQHGQQAVRRAHEDGGQAVPHQPAWWGAVGWGRGSRAFAAVVGLGGRPRGLACSATAARHRQAGRQAGTCSSMEAHATRCPATRPPVALRHVGQLEGLLEVRVKHVHLGRGGRCAALVRCRPRGLLMLMLTVVMVLPVRRGSWRRRGQQQRGHAEAGGRGA